MGFHVIISYPRMEKKFLWIALRLFGDLITGMKVRKFYPALILELITNVEDARLTLYRPQQHPVNDMSLRDIMHASQSNNVISFIDRLRDQLNEKERKKQSLDLEGKLAQLTERFSEASDAVKARLLKDIDRELDVLQTAAISTAQDPPEFKGRRTHRKGGPRKLTAAEIAEKDLAKNDRQSKNRQVVDLTSPKATGLQSTAFENPFNTTIEDIVQSRPHESMADLTTLRSQNPFNSSLNSVCMHRLTRPSMDVIPDLISDTIADNDMLADNADNAGIVVADIWPSEECLGQLTRRAPRIQCPERSILTLNSIENSSQTSASRPKRPPRRRSIYEGELIQSRKRSKHRY